jgi:hypothetical protein
MNNQSLVALNLKTVNGFLVYTVLLYSLKNWEMWGWTQGFSESVRDGGGPRLQGFSKNESHPHFPISL